MATQLVGYREAAQLLAIPQGTLRSMVCRRQIPHVRISPRVVVFDLAALETWVRERCVDVHGAGARTLDGMRSAA